MAGMVQQEDFIMGRLKNKVANPQFNRPAIDSTKTNREWKNVAVKDLLVEDIVAGMGLVNYVFQTCGEDYYLNAGENNEAFFNPDHLVYAFVRKEN